MSIIFSKYETGNCKGCRFSMASCSAAEYVLAVKDRRNKLGLYQVQPVRPCWYKFLHNGNDRLEAYWVLPTAPGGIFEGA